jgi:hypothetical protein
MIRPPHRAIGPRQHARHRCCRLLRRSRQHRHHPARFHSSPDHKLVSPVAGPWRWPDSLHAWQQAGTGRPAVAG